MRKKVIGVIIVLCLLIAFISAISVDWLYSKFEDLKIEEIIFQLKVPLEGTDRTLIYDYLKSCVWKILLATIALSFVLIYPNIKDIKIIKKISTSNKKKTAFISICVAVLIMVTSVDKVVKATDIKEYISYQSQNSKFIEEQYVDPETAEIVFPETKRNLIYIYLESMEATWCSEEDGGLSDVDLIPELTELAKENINFSNTDKVGGAYALYGATWTVGAMTAQSAGIPLKIGIEINSLDQYSVFLGGAYTIGEVLEDNGYHNFLLLGSDATFGGRRNLFTQHGNYEIYDVISAEEDNRISERVWWGYSDDLLFEIAQEKLLELAESDEPFNFTMLTADTHFQDGYLCEDCGDTYDEQYKNVIACSSKKVGEFIEWIQEQDFYENTTIVITGDHLTMQSDFFELEEGEEYDKTVLSIIINSAVETENTKNRIYSTMDLYPTTLAALGATIEGNRLGLGVNLFSDEQTLLEEYGLEYVNDELKKASSFYDNNILVQKKR